MTDWDPFEDLDDPHSPPPAEWPWALITVLAWLLAIVVARC